MPIRVKFNQSTLNLNNRNIILTSEEITDHTVVFLNKKKEWNRWRCNYRLMLVD